MVTSAEVCSAKFLCQHVWVGFVKKWHGNGGVRDSGEDTSSYRGRIDRRDRKRNVATTSMHSGPVQGAQLTEPEPLAPAPTTRVQPVGAVQACPADAHSSHE